MKLKALHFERKSPLDVFNTPSGDFCSIQEIFPISPFYGSGIEPPPQKEMFNFHDMVGNGS